MRKLVLSLFAVLFCAFQLSAQRQQITGTVTDDAGAPIIGATVYVVETAAGTATDGRGVYTINAPADGTIEFSFLGYQSETISIGGRTTIDVVLHQSAQNIDDVVVVGLGYGSGRSLGSMVGSVSAVSGAKLANNPTTNVSDALQGKVAGLQVFSSSGEPSSTNTMRIRGVSSINAGTAPLYLLDGNPITSTQFNMINSNDIESVVVLKDASSTAIYGSRAANGVVYITTKKGSFNQKAQVTVTAQTGWSFRTKSNLKWMNAEELYSFEIANNPGLITPTGDSFYERKMNYVLGNNLSFDWEDYLFTKSAPTSNISVNVAGGTEKTRYTLSMGYNNEDGYFPGSDASRFTIRSNIESKISNWLKMGVNMSAAYLEYQSGTTGWYTNSPLMMVYSMAPYNSPYAAYTDPDNPNTSDIYWGDVEQDQYAGWTGYNYKKEITNGRKRGNNRTNLTVNTFQEITPLDGLTIRFSQSVDGIDTKVSQTLLPSWPGNNGDGQAQKQFARYYNLIATNTIEYSKSFGDHSFSILAGQEAIKYRQEAFGLTVSGLTDDRLLLLTSGNTIDGVNVPSSYVYDTRYVYNSLFSRLTYDYQDKYFLDGSFRRDGSSRFGPNVRWANFWSVGAMWDIGKEDFLARVRQVNNLQFRANYGTTGNSALDSDYLWFGSMGSGPMYDGSTGWYLQSVNNADLTWEKVGSFSMSLDGRFFDMFDLTLEFYNKVTTDMLMEVPYSATTGFSSGWGNVGKMRNRGLEVTAGLDLIHTKDIYWNIEGNLGWNKNKILNLYGDIDEFISGTSGLIYKVGQSAGAFRAVRRYGVDPADGNIIWLTKDGELTKTLDYDADAVDKMNMFADLSGGFGTNFRWKDLSFSAQFSFVGERYMWLNEKLYSRNTTANAGQGNYEKIMLTMWRQPGDVTTIPKYGTPMTGLNDDNYYENAAFLRLKNIQLSYTLPKKWMQATGFMDNARIFVQGRNLLTFTKFNGPDPEIDSNGSQGGYPNSRQVMFGIELMF
ncbi:MAG: TonB-dependent receptor [Rikenellaceae bacterium]|nr:TonB-dependent receptor [Rikenellaceae bacterium]